MRKKWVTLLIVLCWGRYPSEVHLSRSALPSAEHDQWWEKLCCCSSPSACSSCTLFLLPLSGHISIFKVSHQNADVFPTFCYKSYLISFRSVPPHDPEALIAAANYPSFKLNLFLGPFQYAMCPLCCCAQRRDSISRKHVSREVSAFLTLTRIRVLIHIAAPEFQVEKCRCGEMGVRSIIFHHILAKIILSLYSSFIACIPCMALDASALCFYWHTENTDDLCIKTDKHYFLLLFELWHWHSSALYRTH